MMIRREVDVTVHDDDSKPAPALGSEASQNHSTHAASFSFAV
jgi:hypothetical protein